MSPASREGDAAASVAHVAVRVTRTGGFAGLRREWRAEPPAGETTQWIALIQSCPWNATTVADAAQGADRFVWSIRAECGADQLSAELADHDVSGPWRELVDVVRNTADPR
jgi:hypothetical protein